MDMDMDRASTKGTTTVGLACKEGAVLITDKRATMGTLIAHKIVQKSFSIDKHTGATVAGSVADAQALIRWMQAEARLHRMRKGVEMSVEAAATLMANILFSQRYFPMIVQAAVGGYAKEGGRVFSIDPLGSSIEDSMVATGSGSPVAYGVLQDSFKKDLPLEECISIGTRALRAALERDAMTGDGIDILTITAEGTKRFSPSEVEKVIKGL